MADLKTATKAKLTADGTWTTLVSGGTFSPNDLPPEGFTVDVAPIDSNGLLKPAAVFKWSVSTKKEIVRSSERRIFHLYFYEQSGYSTIDQMKHLAKSLLHQKTVVTDREKTCFINWMDDGQDFIDQALNNAAASFSRFYVDLTRK